MYLTLRAAGLSKSAVLPICPTSLIGMTLLFLLVDNYELLHLIALGKLSLALVHRFHSWRGLQPRRKGLVRCPGIQYGTKPYIIKYIQP